MTLEVHSHVTVKELSLVELQKHLQKHLPRTKSFRKKFNVYLEVIVQSIPRTSALRPSERLVQQGWPSEVESDLECYFSMQVELSSYEGCETRPLWGDKLCCVSCMIDVQV